MEEIRQMNPNQRTLGDDSSDSWDGDLEVQQPEQMDVGVMNSNYTSKELYSLTESLSDGDGDSEGDGDEDH